LPEPGSDGFQVSGKSNAPPHALDVCHLLQKLWYFTGVNALASGGPSGLQGFRQRFKEDLNNWQLAFVFSYQAMQFCVTA